MCCTEQGQRSEEASLLTENTPTTHVYATAVICEYEDWISF